MCDCRCCDIAADTAAAGATIHHLVAKWPRGQYETMHEYGTINNRPRPTLPVLSDLVIPRPPNCWWQSTRQRSTGHVAHRPAIIVRVANGTTSVVFDRRRGDLMLLIPARRITNVGRMMSSIFIVVGRQRLIVMNGSLKNILSVSITGDFLVSSIPVSN